MIYASVEDAIALYGTDYVTVSCDRDADGGPDTDSLERHLQAASNKIDGRCIGRVPGWPWEAPPAIFKQYCVDLAIYSSCSTQDVLTEIKKDRYAEAIEYLDAIASGKIRLTNDAGATAGAQLNQSAARVDAGPRVHCGEREFTRDKLKDL